MIELQRTDASALPFILEAEAAARADGHVSGWSEARHLRALSQPDTAYFLVAGADAGAPVGYAIVCGLEPEAASVELKRLVIVDPGRGYGRAALRRIMAMAFDEWHAHRLWLDAFVDNRRARALYLDEGFVEEGVMREAARRGDEFASQVLMSVLVHEYRQATRT